MGTEFSGNPKPFGIIGLIIAIITLILSLVPCIGFYTIIPSIIAIVFCGIAFSYSKKQNEDTSLPLAGMIIGAIAVAVAVYQYYIFKPVFDAKQEIQNSINEVQEEMTDSLENKMIEVLEEKLENELKNDSINEIIIDSLQAE